MTRLSVNINKIALLRNARGNNLPDVIQMALDAERFGAHGITVHPRPDERHITYEDVRKLKTVLKTEFNIEGNPREKKFVDLVLEVQPTQVTLVPDSPGQITSNNGWDTIEHKEFLKEMISVFKEKKIRTCIFLNPKINMVEGAKETGTDRIELYTESYSKWYEKQKNEIIIPYQEAATKATEMGIGVNAGHDLNMKNLKFFKQNIPQLLEVSIGHALICDSIYLGFENTIQMYLRELKG